jgi:hypothetical protein
MSSGWKKEEDEELDEDEGKSMRAPHPVPRAIATPTTEPPDNDIPTFGSSTDNGSL